MSGTFRGLGRFGGHAQAPEDPTKELFVGVVEGGREGEMMGETGQHNALR